MALESGGRLAATMIDLTDRADLVERFSVTTVPYFVVNRRAGFAGPLPELVLLQRIHDQAVGR